MKTYIVQLEDHDDVISARDKIAWSKAGRILLVWPRKGRVLERRVDLLLILRHSRRLGAQLALVTRSSAVKEQAAALGIPVFDDALEAQEASWRRARARGRTSLWKHPSARLARLQKRRQAEPQKLREIRLAEQREQRTALAARISANRWVRAAAFVLGIAAFLLLALAFAPGAEVVVKPERIPQQVSLAVWASPRIAAPSASGGLPAELLLVVVEGRDLVESSGQAKIPERYAAGQATLTNLTDRSVDVPAGSVLLAATSPVVRFVTTHAVTVPAGPEQGAKALIEAQAPGSAGNVAAGMIQAMEGPLGLRLRVNNNSATIGGADRSSRSPTAGDYQGLREKMLENLRANALEEARSRLKPGQRLLDGVLVLSRVIEEEREPAEGQPADRLQLALRVEFAAWAVREADLEAVAQAALDANRDKTLRPVPGSLVVTFTSEPVVEGGGAEISGAGEEGGLTARWNMRVERLLEKGWSEEGAVRLVQGRGLDEAKRILVTGLRLSEPPSITITPGWWGRLPFLPARIKVVSQ